MYSYPELHKLYFDGYVHYQTGEVKNYISGETLDISGIKGLFQYAIKDLNTLIQEKLPEIPSEQRKYAIKYMSDKQFKNFMEEMKVRMENGTATDEQVRQYWEIKDCGTEIQDIKRAWYPKNYIKINQDFLPEIKSLTEVEKGRIFNMMYHIAYNNKQNESIVLNRDLLSSVLGMDDINNIRKFMKKLEDNEILVRVDKHTKKTVTLMFNPLFILKGAEKELTYNMLKMFTKTFNKFIDSDIIRLIELKDKLSVVSIESEADCIEDREVGHVV